MQIIPTEIKTLTYTSNHYPKYTTYNGILTQIINQLNNSNNIIIVSVLNYITLNGCNVWEIKDYYINKEQYQYNINDIIQFRRKLWDSMKVEK